MEKTVFYRAAMALYKKLCVRKLRIFSAGQVETDLHLLHPDENQDWVRMEYYVGKMALFLMILCAGAVFSLAAWANGKASSLLDGSVLERAGPGEEETAVLLRADDGDKAYEFQIRLGARELSEEDAEKTLEELCGKLPELILGDNPSLSEIRSGLRLLEEYDGYPVTVEWESSRPEIVDEEGEVNPGEQEEEVVLRAALTCGACSRELDLEITVLPKELTEEEKAYRELEEYLLLSEESSRQEEVWQLPETWNGRRIKWSLREGRRVLLILGVSAAAAVLVFFLSDRDLHEKLEKRKRILRLEYPDFVHELVLLVGAGMTTRGAFQKMAAEYEQKKRKTGISLPAYEEVLRTCREMQSGVAEGAAYERFGRRTGMQEYVRLSNLLLQNLKRGNSSLPERLREEAYKAGEERLQQSRRLGEEAGTRLLVPMVMMLGVVMLLIMFPAFSSL